MTLRCTKIAALSTGRKTTQSFSQPVSDGWKTQQRGTAQPEETTAGILRTVMSTKHPGTVGTMRFHVSTNVLRDIC